jgi:hypothetical protein
MPVLDDWHGTRHRAKFGRGLELGHPPPVLRRFHSHADRLADHLRRSEQAVKKRNIYFYPVTSGTAISGTAVFQLGHADLAQRFKALAEEWKDATRFSSSPEEIAVHPSYQQIIGMGPDAVPLILAELAREPDQWFWALNAIVGSDIADEAETVEQAARAWIDWGLARGLAGQSILSQ